MLISANAMRGYSIAATDGDIGRVQELYFDDRHWTVRYLVVDTGGWLSGRKVLITPIAVTRVDPDDERVHVELTRRQVEDSPDISVDLPIARQHEIDYYRYYGFPYYWTGGPYAWGLAPSAADLRSTIPPDLERDVTGTPWRERAEDQRLRTTAEVKGYAVRAADGDVGHVDDFRIDDVTWALREIVVDTSWLPGGHVAVPVDWIERVSWADATVYLRVARAHIEGGHGTEDRRSAA